MSKASQIQRLNDFNILQQAAVIKVIKVLFLRFDKEKDFFPSRTSNS